MERQALALGLKAPRLEQAHESEFETGANARDKDQIALLRYEESAALPFSLCWLGALIRPSNLVERTHADIVVVG